MKASEALKAALDHFDEEFNMTGEYPLSCEEYRTLREHYLSVMEDEDDEEKCDDDDGTPPESVTAVAEILTVVNALPDTDRAEVMAALRRLCKR